MKHTVTAQHFRDHLLPSPVPPHPMDAMVSEERAQRYRQVLARRTARLTMLMESCYDPHNASAVVRTCDSFGVQHVHVVTEQNAFRLNRGITHGAHRYITLHEHTSSQAAVAALKQQGYAIYVSALSGAQVSPPQALAQHLGTRKIALVFGAEAMGASHEVLDLADGCFMIPMTGFTQSLNVSVSVAMSLYAMRQDTLVADAPGDLSDAEQIQLYDQWISRQRSRVLTHMPATHQRDYDAALRAYRQPQED